MHSASSSIRRARFVFAGVLTIFAVLVAGSAAQAQVPSSPLVIDEFRYHGPNGQYDNFIELYNPSPTQSYNLNPTGGLPTVLFFHNTLEGNNGCCWYIEFPKDTIVPPNSHFLVAFEGYQPAQFAGTPTPDWAEPTVADDGQGNMIARDIAHDGGVDLYSEYDSDSHTYAALLDEAGFSGDVGDCDCYEGTPLTAPSLTALNAAGTQQYSWVRKVPGAYPQDTNNNANDFAFVAENAAIAGSVRGAPAPQNRQSPTMQNGVVQPLLLDPNASSSAPANRDTQGNTVYIRRTIKNKSATRTVTSLKFRVTQLTTNEADNASQAKLAVIDAPNATVSTSTGSKSVTGLKLEKPPAQIGGGGLNSGIVGVPLPAGGLPPGGTINVQFAFSKAKGGTFTFGFAAEATSSGGTGPS